METQTFIRAGLRFDNKADAANALSQIEATTEYAAWVEEDTDGNLTNYTVAIDMCDERDAAGFVKVLGGEPVAWDFDAEEWVDYKDAA
jgi:hypothetical protein